MPSRIAGQDCQGTTGGALNRYALDEINQGYQDLDDGKLIRGVILHAT